ncbi:MAG: NADH-quinone oxidoreductase subunit J family protein [Gemmatimonadaceae bacterium]
MTLLYQFTFYLFGLIAVASSLLFVTRKNPVAAALWLVNVMICLAALYIMLGAQFVGVVQVIIYAGAIMVVFLFVVMLLNLGHAGAIADARGFRWRVAGAVAGIIVLAQLLVVVRPGPSLLSGLTSVRPAPVDAPPPGANVIAPLAEEFFRNHLLAFEASSVLLLAAIIGAVVLAKRGEGA